MKNLLRTLFGLPAAPTSFKSTDAPSTLQTDVEAVNRRQLVLIAMRDVMRISGIPSDWLECETLNVTSRKKGNGLYIHLIIKHWDERLMRVGWAFQNEMNARLDRFDPKAATWIHGISWQLDVADGCPYTSLPDKSHWDTAPAAVAERTSQQPPPHFPAVPATASAADRENSLATVNFQATQPFSQSELTQDLEKLFAIRDEEMKRARPGSSAQAGGFEKTQPSPLNR